MRRASAPARPAASDGPNSAVSKALRIIEVLVEAKRPLALHEMAVETGMPKPSALRMLLQLEEIGTVKRDVTGKRYVIGDAFAGLAMRTVSHMTRTSTVRDLLAQLVETVGETCNLGVLDGRQVLYLERVESDQPLRMHLRAGSRVPLHATAVGKLILAFLPDEKRDRLLDGPALPRLTENTLTRDALVAQLPEIRGRGFSINREESAIGLIGVAVPVLDPIGNILAGLAIHAPISRFDEAAARAAVPVLDKAAKDIARALQHASGS